MHIEYEIKVLGIDLESVRKDLTNLGATCIKPLRRMKRYAFAHPTKKNAFVRIRQEWGICTATYKEHDTNNAIDSVQEIEVIVSDLEHMRQIFTQCGLREKAYQETYRENRSFGDGVDISIDRRPGLRPFLEVEWPDQLSVEQTIEKLWLWEEETIGGTVSNIYLRELGIPLDIINEMPIITFDNPPARYTG